MALAATEFRSGGRVIDKFSRDSLTTATFGAAPNATDYRSGGYLHDADGRWIVVVETLNAAPTAGSVRSSRLFDPFGRLIVAVSAVAPVAGEVLSGGTVTDSAGRLVVSNETLDAAYSAGDYLSGGRGRSQYGRRLVAGAAGGGSFDPKTIAGLLGWWDFSALGLGNGASIASAPDLSGNANTLSQGTGANQPTFQTAIQNALAMALFNGSTMQMGSALTATTKPLTAFMVLRPITNFSVTRAALGASAAGGFELRVGTSGAMEAVKAGVLLIGGAAASETLGVSVVWTFNYGATGIFSCFRNGVQSGTTQQNDTAFTASTVVIGASVNSEFMLGYIGETLIYNSVLSTPNQQAVEGYLRTKWGTP